MSVQIDLEKRLHMYYILNQIMNPNQIAMIGVLVAFILTFLGLKFPFSFLPVGHGREFAVNGAYLRERPVALV